VGFFGFFWVFLGFIGFFWVFYISPHATPYIYPLCPLTIMHRSHDEVKRRAEEALTPVHVLAALTDGKGALHIEAHAHEAAMDWLREYPGEDGLVSAFVNYECSNLDYFPKKAFFDETVRASMSPPMFWQWAGKAMKAASASRPAVKFCEVMTAIHSTPTSSASVERDFSLYGRIHTKVRNRLGNDKVAKLVKVVRHIRSSDPVEDEEDAFAC